MRIISSFVHPYLLFLTIVSDQDDDDVVVESEKVLEDKPKEAAALRPSIRLVTINIRFKG